MGLTIFKMLILRGIITSDIQLEITFRAAFICRCKPKFPNVYLLNVKRFKSPIKEWSYGTTHSYGIHNANSFYTGIIWFLLVIYLDTCTI